MDFTAGAFFIAFAVPILFFMVVWIVVTIYRLYFPEKPLPFMDDDPANMDRLKKAMGFRSPVTSREIRLQMRREEKATETTRRSGEEESDILEGIPESWHEELWLRRN